PVPSPRQPTTFPAGHAAAFAAGAFPSPFGSFEFGAGVERSMTGAAACVSRGLPDRCTAAAVAAMPVTTTAEATPSLVVKSLTSFETAELAPAAFPAPPTAMALSEAFKAGDAAGNAAALSAL